MSQSSPKISAVSGCNHNLKKEFKHKNCICNRERAMYSDLSCSFPQALVSLNLSDQLMSGSSKAWWHTTSAHCYRRLICGWAESWEQFCPILLMPELICQSLKRLLPRCKAMYYQLLEWFIFLNSFKHECDCKGKLITQFLPATSSVFCPQFSKDREVTNLSFSFYRQQLEYNCWARKLTAIYNL